MNIYELAGIAGLKRHQEQAPGIDGVVGNWADLEDFATLVATEERKAWEHKFAKLQYLMDIRETQPNKPCCLAARADEREACAKLFDNQNIWDEEVSQTIRARGTT